MEHTDVNMGELFSALPETQDFIKYWELGLSLLPRQIHYNLTLFIAVLSCTENQQTFISKEEAKDDTSEMDSTIFSNVLSFLDFYVSPDDAADKPPDKLTRDCESFINLNTTTNLSPALLAFIFMSVALILSTTIYVVCSCLQCKKLAPQEYKDRIRNGIASSLKEESKTVDFKANEDYFLGKPLGAPLLIQTEKDRLGKRLNCASLGQRWEDLFEFTIQRFLKELAVILGISSISSFEVAGAASLPASQDNVSCLTSPHMARRNLSKTNKFKRSPRFIDRVLPHADQSYVQSWITYNNFNQRMSWQFPFTNLDNVNFSQVSQENKKLAIVLQFLHQYCPINPKQWNIAISIVNYTLFILENELRNLCSVTQDIFSISGFQVSGSAADGTLIGLADRFDVLLVLNISSCPELMVLHNNYSDEIPPGHIVLGFKGQQITIEGASCVRKANIKGLCASYLQSQNVVEKIETMLKKAILRLHRNHKSLLDSLPFSFQMAQNKSLFLIVDTRLLHSFGLGIGEISVKITPAFDLKVDAYCLLPPLFAVPLIKNSACSPSAQISPSSGAMSRLLHTPGISDLLWLVHTDTLHSAIVDNFQQSVSSDHKRSCHKECLMVLKALFSPSHHNKLLNKGEVDSYILKTVVSFLLQESPPFAWSLENLAHRFSDAVHFLQSAYENAWLPELCIHNPHLLEKVPSLKIMCQILQGRQRNLLAHMKNQSSLKVLDFVTHRLSETRLKQAVNDQFSSDMWEYEFFMFG